MYSMVMVPFTVFVPANDAITAAIGLFGATDPTQVGVDTLQGVLLTHVISGGEVYSRTYNRLRKIISTCKHRLDTKLCCGYFR